MEGKTITININVLMFAILVILLILSLIQTAQISALADPALAAAKSAAAPVQSGMVGGC